MADFDDLPLDPGSGLEPRGPSGPPVRSGPPLWPMIAIALVVAALGMLWYFGNRITVPPREQTQAGVAQTTVDLPRLPARNPAEPGEPIDLPPLDQSDAVVRALAVRLSSHPLAAAWLTTDGLIRNLTVVIANVASGDTPARHLRPLRPSRTFVMRQSGGLMWIDPASYARYDGIAAAVESLDARGVARFYATVKPRIVEAYRDLGGPDADVDRAVERALVMLLRTPIVDEPVQLQAGKVTYLFANSALERLPGAQRQFLRMGPRNMRIVKAKLREVAGHLGIPDATLPPG